MKWLILLLMVLIGAVLAALVAAQEPGYVLIIYQDWKIETSLTLLVGVLVVVGIILYYLIRSLTGLTHVPKKVGAWRRSRLDGRAESALNQGMLALFEGDWKRAEKLLVKRGKLSHSPLLNYLGAARAAQQLGAFDQRDEYLRKAALVDDSAKIAVGLTQARLQLDQKQYEQALACLENLRRIAPKHCYVLRLLAELYRILGEWSRLEDLFPTLKRLRIFDEQELAELQKECYCQLLIQYDQSEGYHSLHQLWRRMPKALHQDIEVVCHYTEWLLLLEEDDEAEVILRTTLSIHWDTRLLVLYGKVKGSNGQQQLNYAEAWLKNHNQEPSLYHSLGLICMRNQLWGKARDYLQSAVDMGHKPSMVELVMVLEQLGESELIYGKLRQGLALLKS